jgi:biotin transport system substrate-specific component
LGILFGPTAGYIWAFPIAAFIAGIFRKLIWRKGRKHEMLLLWISSFIAAIPIYLLGFVVFYHFTTINANLMRWSEMAAGLLGLNLDPFTTVFVASVLLFVPQDFFVDQLLAVYVFRYVEEMIRQRGFEI